MDKQQLSLLKFHPYAEVFPLKDTDPDAWVKLVEDVRANGVLEKIVLVGDAILDGRNRYLAAVEVGQEIDQFNSCQYHGRDPLAFVVSKNLQRRHLTTSQRAMAAARLANMRQGERTDLEPSANSQKVSQTQAAALMNVSARTLSDAKDVLDASSELADRVSSGEMTVAMRTVTLVREGDGRRTEVTAEAILRVLGRTGRTR
jgi:hypothetical protein